MTFPSGAQVTWLDSSNRRHEGVVDGEMPLTGQIRVVETLTVTLPHMMEPHRLEAAPEPGNEREGGSDG